MKAIDRIYEYIKNKGVSISHFEKKVGLSNGYLGKQKRRNADIGEGVMLKILENCPDINPEWLLTGKGSMLRDETNIIYQQEFIPAVKADKLRGKPIPLVTQEAVAGFGGGDFSISEQDVKEYYVIPKFKYHKVDFMIEVYGNSMYPKYNSGDIIACTIITDSKFIQWNKPHVIATRYQGILVKRIFPGLNDETLLLKSDNKDYAPFEVPKDEITGIALVVGVIRSE